MNMKKNDMFLGIYLLAAVVFFIIPIPSWLLDVLILFNVSMSLIIVFNCLFTSETLNISGFPTLLLFTTIFVYHLMYHRQDLFFQLVIRERS